MLDISYQDIRQQYLNSVVLFKGKPVKVKKVYEDRTVRILDLRSQRSRDVVFDMKHFSPPVTRLGYVNRDGAAVYVSRKPQRQYQTGVSASNCSVAGFIRTDELLNIEEVVKAMECPEFADMMLGNYPSLPEAYKEATKNFGSVAFDKMFAVTYDGKIFYKNIHAGTYREENDSIDFLQSVQHLRVCLKGKYAEAPRTFR